MKNRDDNFFYLAEITLSFPGTSVSAEYFLNFMVYQKESTEGVKNLKIFNHKIEKISNNLKKISKQNPKTVSTIKHKI